MTNKQKKSSIITLLYHRRYWILSLTLLALLVGQSLYFSIKDIHRHSFEIATVGARNMVNVVKMTRLWNALHGNIYAPVSELTKPNPYLNVTDRDIETTDGLQLTMINPAFMTRQIAETSAAKGIRFHITSNKPLRPANAPDSWERSALVWFEKG